MISICSFEQNWNEWFFFFFFWNKCTFNNKENETIDGTYIVKWLKRETKNKTWFAEFFLFFFFYYYRSHIDFFLQYFCNILCDLRFFYSNFFFFSRYLKFLRFNFLIFNIYVFLKRANIWDDKLSNIVLLFT